MCLRRRVRGKCCNFFRVDMLVTAEGPTAAKVAGDTGWIFKAPSPVGQYPVAAEAALGMIDAEAHAPTLAC